MATLNYGWFKAVKEGLQTSIYHVESESLVAAIIWVPDPHWPHYEVLDWSGIAVETAIEEPQAHKILTDVVNAWLKEEYKYAAGKGTSEAVEEV